ncbi:MAG: hypothetical protein ACI4D8_05110 [Wujia sp.]
MKIHNIEKIIMHPIDKNMSNGMRCLQQIPLTDEEIEYVRKELRAIEADESIFVFNDKEHITQCTCYNYKEDKIFVTKNVFPDKQFGPMHPRDLMSVRAVLADEYYGHRTFREEYLSDFYNNVKTTPDWEDECRASITAAKITPNLDRMDKSVLIQNAIYRAEEAGMYIEYDEFMKEVLFGYSEDVRNSSSNIGHINFVNR